MATGGEEIQMDPIGDARNQPLPENYNKEFGETSFNNPVYDDATTYNTSDNSNLNSDVDFTTPIRPRPETIEPFSGQGKLLAGGTLLRQKIDYTIIADRLRDALAGTDWPYTNTGINNLASRILLYGKNIVYVPELWEINDMTDVQKANMDKRQNPNGTFTYQVLIN